MKIEVGKTYKNRRGDVLGPVESHIDEDFPFMTMTFGVLRTYTPEGGYYFGDEYDDNDLVEECNADGSPIVPEPEEDHVGTPSWATTFDKQHRQEIAYGVLTAMIASPHVCNRADVDKAKWCRIAFEWADEFIKVAKQS